MSHLLFLTNRLKAQASRDWLTNSQKKVLFELKKNWRFPGKLNLCGPPGCGKTFLGWTFCRQTNETDFFSHAQGFSATSKQTKNIVLDNIPSEENAFRRLLAVLQLRQVRRALLISTRPIPLNLPKLILPAPTTEDIAKIFDNFSYLALETLSDNPVNTPTKANLWDIIYSIL